MVPYRKNIGWGLIFYDPNASAPMINAKIVVIPRSPIDNHFNMNFKLVIGLVINFQITQPTIRLTRIALI